MLLFYRNKTLSRLSILNVIGFRNKRRIISAYLGLFTKPMLFYRNKTLSRLSILNVIGFRNKRRIISAYLGLFTKPMLNTILRLSNSGCKIHQILTLRFKSSSACTSQIRLFSIPTGLSAVADQTRIFPKKSKYKFCHDKFLSPLLHLH